MRISPTTIDQVRQIARIEEVVSDFIALKKAGSSYKACCPFHDEKTPSFNVTPAKGIFKCFGCGKGGDSITFVMEYEKISYTEAIRWLAKRYSIEVVEERSPDDADTLAYKEKESLFAALSHAATYYQDILENNEEGQSIGASYFRERGLLPSTIRTFGLGFSLESWSGLLDNAQKAGFTPEVLEKAGLLNRKESDNNTIGSQRYYDRFRGRVMYPIHNASGRVAGFGARTLKNDKKEAKYINSPETLVYHKSDILYGLYQAKRAIHAVDMVYLVEGYMDVLALYQAGVQNVVASSGTSLTIEQIRLIKRHTTNLTFLFDGDKAGIKAALRGIDMVLEAGLNVRVLTFPDGDDPDSYIRKVGPEAFGMYLKNRQQDFITFKASLYAEEAQADPIRRAEIIHDVVQSIAKVEDNIQRAAYFHQAAKVLGADEHMLVAEGNRLRLKQFNTQRKQNDAGRIGTSTPPAGPAGRILPLPQAKPLPSADNLGYMPSPEDMPDMAYDADGQAIFPPLESWEIDGTQPVALPPSSAPNGAGQGLGEIPIAQFEALSPVDRQMAILVRYEREAIRLLLNYGEERPEDAPDESPLAYYLLETLGSIGFQDPVAGEIFWHYQEALNERQIIPPATELFGLGKPAISHFVADALTFPHKLSPNFELRTRTPIPDERAVLEQKVEHTIKHLYLENNRLQQAQVQVEVHRLSDPAEKFNCLVKMRELKKTEQEILKELGVLGK